MTPEQTALLTKRQASFRESEARRLPALIEFIGKIGIEPSHHVGTDPAAYLPHLSKVLATMPCDSDRERTILSARVAEYVGEYFAQRFGGTWFVNDTPESATFARYVVGRFLALPGSPVCIDPFDIGMKFARLPVPRDLAGLLAEVERDFRIAVNANAPLQDPPRS